MAYTYKVVGSDMKMGSKRYKEGATLISSVKLNYSCLEPVKEEVFSDKFSKPPKTGRNKKYSK